MFNDLYKIINLTFYLNYIKLEKRIYIFFFILFLIVLTHFNCFNEVFSKTKVIFQSLELDLAKINLKKKN